MSDEVAALEKQLYELTVRLNALKRDSAGGGEAVPNYTFDTTHGEASLLDFFGDRDTLLVIHNMGQGCRYCTLWADGFNGFLPHLESAMSVLLVSKDPPQVQRRFANARGWRFQLASHGGGDYIREQTVLSDSDNMPGAVVYEREDGVITRRHAAVFGPGDLYCSIWNLLGLAGLTQQEWTPQFNYWIRPEKLDDGGENVLG